MADYRARKASGEPGPAQLSAGRTEPRRAPAARAPARAPGRAPGRAQPRPAALTAYRVGVTCDTGHNPYYYVQDVKPGETISCPICSTTITMPTARVLTAQGCKPVSKTDIEIDQFYLEPVQTDTAPAKGWAQTVAEAFNLAPGNAWSIPGAVKPVTANPVMQTRKAIAALPSPALTADERELIRERANMNDKLETLYRKVKAARRYAHLITNGSRLFDVAERDITNFINELDKVTDVTGAPNTYGSLSNLRNRVWNECKPIEGMLRRVILERDK
jgi:uncharacterized protein (DUF1778 family)